MNQVNSLLFARADLYYIYKQKHKNLARDMGIVWDNPEETTECTVTNYFLALDISEEQKTIEYYKLLSWEEGREGLKTFKRRRYF